LCFILTSYYSSGYRWFVRLVRMESDEVRMYVRTNIMYLHLLYIHTHEYVGMYISETVLYAMNLFYLISEFPLHVDFN